MTWQRNIWLLKDTNVLRPSLSSVSLTQLRLSPHDGMLQLDTKLYFSCQLVWFEKSWKCFIFFRQAFSSVSLESKCIIPRILSNQTRLSHDAEWFTAKLVISANGKWPISDPKIGIRPAHLGRKTIYTSGRHNYWWKMSNTSFFVLSIIYLIHVYLLMK